MPPSVPVVSGSKYKFPLIVGAVAVLLIGIVLFVGNSVGINVFSRQEYVVSKTPKKIGVMYSRQQADVFAAFKEELKNLGYDNAILQEKIIVVGPNQDVDIESAANEFLSDDVDLIWTGLEHLTKGVLKVTAERNDDTPVVFASKFHDPIKFGIAESWKSSGNNATGVATNIIEVVQKHLEFLGRINPDIKKIAVFSAGFMVPDVGDEFYTEFKTQAERFGYEVVDYTTTVSPDQTEQSWKEIAATIEPGDIDAIYHIAGHFYGPQEVEEMALANRLQVPHMVPVEDLVAGGQIGYSPDQHVSGVKTAQLVDRIFRGEEPSDIPIESLVRHTLVLNEKRAHDAGLTFPESLLSIADTIVR
jgi:putative ABC transport system substrate-binding protein